ncbi:MAG: tetratricopeptide repeat protein, partial [Planctomycetes bacterium]|nr:tetratricopeptide repeat protein [Planctomycetota bacterium]
AARDQEQDAALAKERARRETVEEALGQAAQGALEDREFAFEQATFRLVRNLDPATLALLCERLTKISAKLREVEATLWRRALGSEAEVILALLPQRIAGQWSPKDEHVWQREARRLEAWYARQSGATARATTILGSEQTRVLGQGEIAVARLIVSALAQSTAPEAQRALETYLRSEQNSARAARAGRALCLGDSPRSGRVLHEALKHFGPRSPFANEVTLVLGQASGLTEHLGEDAGDPARAVALGSVLQRQGKLEESLKVLDAALAHGENANLLVERSITLRRMRRLPEALTAAERASQLAPSFVPARLARLFCLRDLGRVEEGLAESDRILGRNRRVTPAHLMRATFLNRLGRKDEAIAAFGDAIAVDPDEVEAYTNRALLNLAKSERASGEAQQELEAAVERDLKVAKRLSPGNLQAISLRADLALARGRPERAISLLDQAIERQPRQGFLWFTRAKAKQAAGDLDGAKRDGRRAKELGEQRAGALLASLDRPAKDDAVGGLYDQGLRLVRTGRLSEAKQVARRLQSSPKDSSRGRGHALQALIWIHKQRYRRALEEAERAVEVLPKDAEGHHQKGLALYFLNDVEGSVAAYTQALALGPRAATLLTNRATSYVAGWQRGKRPWAALATKDLEASLQLDGNQPGAWGNLGLLRARGGDRPGAIKAFKRSVELAPNHPMAERARQTIRQLESGR